MRAMRAARRLPLRDETRTNRISARSFGILAAPATDTAANNGNGLRGYWVAPTSGPAFQHRICRAGLEM